MTRPLTLIARTMAFDRRGNCAEDDRAVVEVTGRYDDGDIEIAVLNKQRGENDLYIRLSLVELVQAAMLRPVSEE